MYIYMYAYKQTTRIKIHMQILLNALRLNSIIHCKLIRINSKHLQLQQHQKLKTSDEPKSEYSFFNQSLTLQQYPFFSFHLFTIPH